MPWFAAGSSSMSAAQIPEPSLHCPRRPEHLEVEISEGCIQIYHKSPCDGNVQRGELLGKQLSTERERVIQEKDTFPETDELMGRTEMDSPAPQVKAYFLWHRHLINALLTRGWTLQDNSPSNLQSRVRLSPWNLRLCIISAQMIRDCHGKFAPSKQK